MRPVCVGTCGWSYKEWAGTAIPTAGCDVLK
jgi:uncharacterized protein YecE (DUF72 family)